MREHYDFWHTVDVRWGDMDSQRHVNNAKYFTYFESARIAFFDTVRLHSHGDERNEGPALVTTTCNFKRQVRYPARLDIGVRLTRLGNRSIGLELGVFFEGTDELVADGSSVNAWMNYDDEVSADLPAALRAALEPHLREPLQSSGQK